MRTHQRPCAALLTLLVALATVADVVPLVGENRVIAKLGLELLTKGPHKVGLRALIDVCGLTGKTIDEATARAAAKAAMQAATPLSQNGYKTQLFQTAIYRTILLAAGQMQRDPSSIG